MNWLRLMPCCLTALAACGGNLTNEGCDTTYGGVIYDLSLQLVSADTSSLTLTSQVLADDYYVPATSNGYCGVPAIVGQTDISSQRYGLSVAVSGCTGTGCSMPTPTKQPVSSATAFSVKRSQTELLRLVVTCADPSDPRCNHGHPHEFPAQSAAYCVAPGANVLQPSEAYSCRN